jgi:hypothetical protein
LLKAIKEHDPSAPPSAEALEDDSRVMIIAGRYLILKTQSSDVADMM